MPEISSTQHYFIVLKYGTGTFSAKYTMRTTIKKKRIYKWLVDFILKGQWRGSMVGKTVMT